MESKRQCVVVLIDVALAVMAFASVGCRNHIMRGGELVFEMSARPKGAPLSCAEAILPAVREASACGGGTVELVDGTYHFYSHSATNMRFHVSNHDQPRVRPVFLPLIGVTNVAAVAGGKGV